MYDNKIVLAIFSLQGGGAERFVLTVAKAFASLAMSLILFLFLKKAN